MNVQQIIDALTKIECENIELKKDNGLKSNEINLLKQQNTGLQRQNEILSKENRKLKEFNLDLKTFLQKYLKDSELTAEERKFLKQMTVQRALSIVYYDIISNHDGQCERSFLAAEVERRINPLKIYDDDTLLKDKVYNDFSNKFGGLLDSLQKWGIVYRPTNGVHRLTYNAVNIIEDKIGHKIIDKFLSILNRISNEE